MEEQNKFSTKHNSTSIDGKQIIWTLSNHLNAHMKTEPLKRREQLKELPRLKKQQQQINEYISDESNCLSNIDVNKSKNDQLLFIPPMEYNSIERREKKQVGIVKPLLTVEKQTNQWNCSELEKLQRRFSELIDGKSNEDKTLPINESLLIERIESLYSSMGSLLYVSPCLIRLFILTDLQACSLEQWKLIHRGYPIWLYNTGLNPRRSSELRLMIVDEKTGFILWSDRITSISNIIQPTTLTLSFRHSLNNSSIMLRFESNDDNLFTKFYSYLKQNRFLTENLSNHKILKRFIKKSDISPPCHFKHFNHIEENITDVHHLYY
ncbi:unnamed protein product [Rotaria socialis]|uniref:Uncharacterized protein n=1 Tax=Rotaria socialis TaxID=392032 RepID=A0A819ZRI1_9BILA|nr:unnamed protein product [Rotaria socialis]CAF3315098.1 unnamed protein product [Rotaria socialis]CAF3320315.1 unnamed protein product [Rotaria socialis]CAF3326796.1 unnamed protein product [Rotaria socialis]CAF3470729.1 unnamed protein product [Rotaria socialis]